MQTPSIYTETIGPLRINVSGRVTSFARAKDRALFAFLAVNKGRAYNRPFLVDLLWNQSSEEKGRHSLNQAIYSIRRVLPQALIAEQGTVRCGAETVQTDVDRLHECIRAGRVLEVTDLIRGDFLADVDLADSPRFDEWKGQFRRQIILQVENALKPHLVQSPSFEIGSELTDIAHLADVIKHLRTAVMVTGLPLAGGAESRTEERGAVVCENAFVGRDLQRNTLRQAWACSEGGSYALIRGFAGYGKTKLAEEFLNELEPTGVRTLRVTCYEGEKASAFRPIADLLTDSISHQDVNGLDDIWLAALQQLAPTIAPHPITLPSLSAAGAKSRLSEAFASLMRLIAQHEPTILFIDDVQWCDASSRALFSYLHRQRLDAPLMVLAAIRVQSRTAEMALPWRSWDQVEVHEFTGPDLQKLIAMYKVSSTISSRQLLRLTGGHPFLTVEVLRTLAANSHKKDKPFSAGLPSSAEEFISQAFSGLPNSYLRVAAALGIIRRPAKASMVGRIAHSAKFVDAASTLMDRGILDFTNERLRFRHELLRDAVVRRTPTPLRVELHRRAARILAQIPNRTGEAAEHFYNSGMPKHAFRFALKAADAAEERQRLTQAAYYLRLALKTKPPNTHVLCDRLATVLYKAGRYRQARRVLLNVMSNSERFSERERVQQQLLDLEMSYFLAETPGRSLRQHLESLIETESIDEDLKSRAMRLQLRSALLEGTTSTIDRRVDPLRKFGVAHLKIPEGVMALASAVLAESIAFSSKTADIWAKPLYGLAETLGDYELKIQVLTLLGVTAYGRGDLSLAESLNMRALEEMRRVGAVTLWTRTLAHIHAIKIEQGDYAAAETVENDLLMRIGRGDIHNRATYNANKASMLFELGRFEEAKRCAELALKFSRRFSVVWHRIGLRGLMGLIALERGNLQEATAAAQYGIQKVDRLNIRLMDISTMEILIARVFALSRQNESAIARLNDAITRYGDRELICRLQLRLELARQLKSIDRHAAREHAKAVYETARTIGARPIADRADSLLYRL